MNKRTPTIILSAIIAIAIIGVSAKPLLIKYQLYKYSRIPAISQILINPDAFDLSAAKSDIDDKGAILSALERLGYLSSFSIPIKTLSANADKYIDGISTYADSHAIPLVVGIDDLTANTFLYVVDKPETRPFWEAFVRFHIESKESGQQSGAECARRLASPDGRGWIQKYIGNRAHYGPSTTDKRRSRTARIRFGKAKPRTANEK